MSPAISVLIPAFNAAAYIEGTIHSVLAQTRSDWEIVVVDNASTDGTFASAQRMAGLDTRIRVFRNEVNVGPVRNWLRCVEHARAPIAGLLFADDRYHPGFLERVAPHLSDGRVGFAYSAVSVRMLADGSETVGYRMDQSGVYDSRIFLEAHYRETEYSVPSSPGCALFRVQDLARSLRRPMAESDVFGFYDHGAGPDVRCFWDCCSSYPRFAYEAEPLVTFTLHGANLSSRRGIRASYQRAWLQWLDEYPQKGFRMSRARARAWVVLRNDSLRRAVVGRLGVSGVCELPSVVATTVCARGRRWARGRRRGVRSGRRAP